MDYSSLRMRFFLAIETSKIPTQQRPLSGRKDELYVLKTRKEKDEKYVVLFFNSSFLNIHLLLVLSLLNWFNLMIRFLSLADSLAGERSCIEWGLIVPTLFK